uniref:Ig-like domain-containing protein n=1 Tax=Parastrongyloides trichosuri TaxID=131310 RepID=A0A0N4ZPD3_PARTI
MNKLGAVFTIILLAFLVPDVSNSYQNIPSGGIDITGKSILLTVKGEGGRNEGSSTDDSSIIKDENVEFYKLISDGNEFDFASLNGGPFRIQNSKTIEFICGTKDLNPDILEKYEIKIGVLKKMVDNSWKVLAYPTEVKQENDYRLRFKLTFSEIPLRDTKFEFLHFIGDFKCKFVFKNKVATSQRIIKVTEILPIRFAPITLLVDSDMLSGTNISLSCPDLSASNIKFERGMYFDSDPRNYVEGNYQRVIFTKLPYNTLRSSDNRTILIREIRHVNMGFYHCIYNLNEEENSGEFRLIYKIRSSDIKELKVNEKFLHFVFIFMLSHLALLALGVIYH